MEKIYRGMANGAETIDRNFNNGYGQKVGDIHISIDSSNPSARFGGTWERFANGRTLVGVDESDSVQLMKTSGQNGGKTNPLSAHFHKVNRAGGTGTSQIGYNVNWSDGTINAQGMITEGDNTDHNNWQPFVTVYMWVRTA